MVPFICPQNIDGINFNIAASTSSDLHSKSYSILLSIFFKSNPSLLNHKKIDEKFVKEFLQQNVCHYIGIKGFLLKQTNFWKYIQEIVIYIVIIGKKHLSLNIWPEISNQNIDIKNLILTI